MSYEQAFAAREDAAPFAGSRADYNAAVVTSFFENPHVVSTDPDDPRGGRFVAVGRVGAVISALTYAMEGQSMRVISLRPARDQEREKFLSVFRDW